jgi:hypothetical protein
MNGPDSSMGDLGGIRAAEGRRLCCDRRFVEVAVLGGSHEGAGGEIACSSAAAARCARGVARGIC